MKHSMLTFFREQCGTVPPVVKVDLSGMTVVVVGANAGLGYDATVHFASMNPARLIMACRSKERGEAAVRKLDSETGYKAELWLVDLASFASVSAFADRFDHDGGRLDILVMNAGLMKPEYEATVDGWESCLQVNNLASPHLSLRMLPHMVRTAKECNTTPRLVTVSSEVHYWATIENELRTAPALLEKLSDPTYCTPKILGENRYFICKLLNVLFTRALQQRLSESDSVTAVCLTPNLCQTEFRSSVDAGRGKLESVVVGYMLKMLAFTSEQGSRQLVYAAVGGREHEEEMRGAYVALSGVREPSDFVISEDGQRVQDQYWGELMVLLSKVDEKVISIAADLLR